MRSSKATDEGSSPEVLLFSGLAGSEAGWWGEHLDAGKIACSVLQQGSWILSSSTYQHSPPAAETLARSECLKAILAAPRR